MGTGRSKAAGAPASHASYTQLQTLGGDADGDQEAPEAPQLPNPEESASWLSRITFSFMNPLLKLGRARALEADDLWELAAQDRSEEVSRGFESALEREPGMWRAFRRAFSRPFLLVAGYKLCYDLLIFASPAVLHRTIDFVQSPPDSAPWWLGGLYALGLLVPPLLQSGLIHQYFHRLYRLSAHVQTATVTSVYRKSLRLSSAARQQGTVGEIVNLMSVDAARISQIIPYLHQMWSAPLQISISLVMLFRLLGWATAAGVAVMIVLIPINGWLASRLTKVQEALMGIKDERTKVMNELLQGIRAVKFYSWEQSVYPHTCQFLDRVSEVRSRELRALRGVQFLNAFSSFFWTTTSDLGRPLDPPAAFTALALFNILRFPLNVFPDIVSGVVDMRVSVGRLDRFMKGEELQPNEPDPTRGGAPAGEGDREAEAIRIEGGRFRWSPTGRRRWRGSTWPSAAGSCSPLASQCTGTSRPTAPAPASRSCALPTRPGPGPTAGCPPLWPTPCLCSLWSIPVPSPPTISRRPPPPSRLVPHARPPLASRQAGRGPAPALYIYSSVR